MNPRVRDGLLGAGVAVVVLVVTAWLLLVAVTEPARDRAAPGSGVPASATPGPGAAPAPADLGAAELWLDDVVLDAATVVVPGSTLRDVAVDARGVRTGPDGLVAESMSVEVTVPYEAVAAELGDHVVVRAGEGSHAVVERPVVVAGRRIDVVATGTVEVVEGRLVVEPTSIDVGGPAVLARVLGAAARRLVTIEHEVEGLPAGLELRDVAVHDDGFRAGLSGADVSLAFPAGPAQ